MSAPSPAAPPRTRADVHLRAVAPRLVEPGAGRRPLAALAHSATVLPETWTLARELQERRGADLVLDPLLRVASVPGNAPWDVLLYGAAVAVALLFRHWPATLLVALTATGDAMGGTVKLLVARARPTADLVTIYRYAARVVAFPAATSCTTSSSSAWPPTSAPAHCGPERCAGALRVRCCGRGWRDSSP